jgi:hypothetical protein
MRRAGRVVLYVCAGVLVLDVVLLATGAFGYGVDRGCDSPCGSNLGLVLLTVFSVMILLSCAVLGGYAVFRVVRWGLGRRGPHRASG